MIDVKQLLWGEKTHDKAKRMAYSTGASYVMYILKYGLEVKIELYVIKNSDCFKFCPNGSFACRPTKRMSNEKTET